MLKERDKKTAKDRVMYRRRRNVLIFMSEFLVCMLLAIACFGVTFLKSYGYEELDPDVYKESMSLEESAKMKTIEYETDENGNIISSKEVEKEIATNQGFRNILVLGTDARNNTDYNSSGINTDVIMILSINNATKDVKIASVLRDTILRMENGSFNKANSQYYTGISDTVSMINRNLGLDIDEYIIVNWYGVATCIDQLGGVEITIPDAKTLSWFNGYLTEVNSKTGIWAPQFTAPGTYMMRGTQAVAFCRIRYGGLNDTGRTNNQREVVGKMLGRAKTLFAQGQINQLLTVGETALSNVKTNFTLPEIIYMATEIGTYNMTGSYQFPKDYSSGKYLGNFAAKYNVFDALCANDFEKEVKDLHIYLFGDKKYEPSSYVKEISEQMRRDRLGQ